MLIPSTSNGSRRHVHGDGLAVGDEQAERVGDVELALRVVRLETVEYRPELLGAEDVDAGVHLAELVLLGRGVGRLDDAGEPPGAVAHDPPVPARVLRLEGQHRAGGALAAVRLDESADERRGQGGDVAVEHEHVAGRISERGSGGAHGVARAERHARCTATSTPSNESAVSGEATTTTRSTPAARAACTTQSTIRRPSNGCRCFGVALFMRVPRPPAITTAARSFAMSGGQER